MAGSIMVVILVFVSLSLKNGREISAVDVDSRLVMKFLGFCHFYPHMVIIAPLRRFSFLKGNINEQNLHIRVFIT